MKTASPHPGLAVEGLGWHWVGPLFCMFLNGLRKKSSDLSRPLLLAVKVLLSLRLYGLSFTESWDYLKFVNE